MRTTNNEATKEIAKREIRKNWEELISTGDMTHEEMADSLKDQIDGYEDMSLEELTEEIADLMGWDINELTEEQAEEWKGIVDETATEWLNG